MNARKILQVSNLKSREAAWLKGIYKVVDLSV